jgi:methionyl-tRNA formyltransferase
VSLPLDPSKISIVFFGNERLATGVTTVAPTLRKLIAAGYNVVAVVSHNSDTRSRSARQLEIAGVATEHNIPVLLPEKPALVIEQIRAMQPDIGVLVAYGKIVPSSVMDVFPHGIINIHPSLLPLHRGPIPIESVILQGAAETGVSIMQLAVAMDAGPVYGQVRADLQGDETKQALATQLLEAGGNHLLQILPSIVDGSLAPTPQNEATATYDALIQKADGLLDFNKPAARLEREIRAYLDWPGSRTSIGDKDVIITAAHVLVLDDSDNVAADATNVAETADSTTDATDADAISGSLWRSGKQLGFYTSDGVLVIDRLKPAGKSDMTAEAFLAGNRI